MTKNTIFVLAGVILALSVVLFFQSLTIRKVETLRNVPAPPPATSTPSPDQNLIVTSPVLNQEVSSPITVTGRARVFENQFNYRLKDTDGRLLSQGSATASAPDAGQFGPFTFTVSYPAPATRYGILEIYDLSPKNGSAIDQVILYLKFSCPDCR